MKSVRNLFAASAVAAAHTALIGALAMAANPPAVDSLTPKGVRCKVEKDGALRGDTTVRDLRSLDQLEKFFANGAELSDEGFKSFAGWKNLKSSVPDHWGWCAPGFLRHGGTINIAHPLPVETCSTYS